MTFRKRLFFVSSATAVYIGGTAAAYSMFKWQSDSGGEAGAAASFDGMADKYDSLVNREETFMGLKFLRWWLVRQAKVRRSMTDGLCMSWDCASAGSTCMVSL